MRWSEAKKTLTFTFWTNKVGTKVKPGLDPLLSKQHIKHHSAYVHVLKTFFFNAPNKLVIKICLGSFYRLSAFIFYKHPQKGEPCLVPFCVFKKVEEILYVCVCSELNIMHT